MPPNPTFAHRHPWCVFALGLLIGCAAVDPGGQTATALRQRFLFGWNAESNFNAEGDGSQTGAFTMIEGSIIIGDDGLPDLNRSTITSFLAYTPQVDATASAYTAALQASTAQVESLTSLIGVILPAVLPQLISQQHDPGGVKPP